MMLAILDKHDYDKHLFWFVIGCTFADGDGDEIEGL